MATRALIRVGITSGRLDDVGLPSQKYIGPTLIGSGANLQEIEDTPGKQRDNIGVTSARRRPSLGQDTENKGAGSCRVDGGNMSGQRRRMVSARRRLWLC